MQNEFFEKAGQILELEKNTRAIAFYNRHGFIQTGGRKFEEGTTEYIVELKREPADGEGET